MSFTLDNPAVIDEDGILICPFCDGTYLHHKEIEIFNRIEDASIGLHVTVEHDCVNLDQSMVNNPSLRRTGFLIYFWCETCETEQEPVLSVVQHKGQTFLQWTTSDSENKALLSELADQIKKNGQ
jgi:hypothetical protein